MSSVSTLVLVILVTFIRCSCALQCYYHDCEYGDVSAYVCDSPFSEGGRPRGIPVVNCSSLESTCGMFRGRAISKIPSCQSFDFYRAMLAQSAVMRQ